MLRNSNCIVSLISTFSCSLLFPSFVFAEVLAFKVSGITDRSAQLMEVDLYESGNPQYYTSRSGEVLQLNLESGRLESVRSLPSRLGASGCAIAKKGTDRPDPLYLAGAPDADTANGARGGVIQLVNMSTGSVEGQPVYGASSYSRLGREILTLGEAELPGSNNTNVLSAFFAVSEDRSPLHSSGSRVRVLQVGRSSQSATPVLANSCNFDFRRIGLNNPFLMTAIEDQTGDGIQELFVVASTCSLEAGSSCTHSYYRSHVLDVTRCEELGTYERSIPSTDERTELRSIVNLGDYRGNGNQHIGIAESSGGLNRTAKLHIQEIYGQHVRDVRTITGPDESFGFAMAYNGETLAVSSPHTDYYPNLNNAEGAIHLIDRGTFHIRDSFGGGGKRENKIGGALQYVEREGQSLLVSTALTPSHPKMDFFETSGEQFSLAGTACSDFRRESDPAMEIDVDLSPSMTSIDFSVSGLDSTPGSRSFLFIDGINSGRSTPYFRSWGQSCETTINFAELISSPELTVNSAGEATFSLDYIPGSIPYFQESDLTALAVTISFDRNGYPHLKTSEELHFNIP